MSRVALALAFGLVALGCNRGPQLAKVRGAVSVDGKPVTTGTITFQSELGRPAFGVIGPDGTYSLTTHVPDDGAIVGEHVVTIHATRVGAGSLAPTTPEEELALSQKGAKGGAVLIPGKVEWLVPEKYATAQTSTLRATVEAKDNVIPFDLPK